MASRSSVALSVARDRALGALADYVLIPLNTVVGTPIRLLLRPIRAGGRQLWRLVCATVRVGNRWLLLPAGRGVRAVYRSGMVPVYRGVVAPTGRGLYRYVLAPVGRGLRATGRGIDRFILAPTGRGLRATSRGIDRFILAPTGRGLRATGRGIDRFILAPTGRGLRATGRGVYRYVLVPTGRGLRATGRGVYRYVLVPVGRGLRATGRGIDRFILAPTGRGLRATGRGIDRFILAPTGRGLRAAARATVLPAARAVDRHFFTPALRLLRWLTDPARNQARLEWALRGFRPVPLLELRSRLLVVVSTSRLMQPTLASAACPVRARLLEACAPLVERDPEFVLQTALYARRELQLRSVANFLLGFGAATPALRPLLRRYARATLLIPGDLCETVALASSLRPTGATPRKLWMPGCLRAAAADKMAAFSEQQLAKHGSKQTGGVTLKQVVRVAHVSQPAGAVCAVLGKRYPATEEAFARSSLAAAGLAWEPERAGRRMKLPPVDSWDRELSRGGDRGEAWRRLVRERRLPFLAAVRNVRNVAHFAADDESLAALEAFLTDAAAVQRCRVLPTQLVTAGLILGPAALQAEQALRARRAARRAARRPAPADDFRDDDDDELPDKADDPAIRPRVAARLRAVLDMSLKLSVSLNTPALAGRTCVVVDAGPGMLARCRFSSVPGRLENTCCGAATLLALLLRYACEEAELLAWSGVAADMATWLSPLDVPAGADTVFDELEQVTALNTALRAPGHAAPLFVHPALERWAREGHVVDRLVVLTHQSLALHELHDVGARGGGLARHLGGATLARAVRSYRASTSPGFTVCTVDVAGAGAEVMDLLAGSAARGAEDKYIAGLTDSVLRHIAEPAEDEAAQVQRVLELSDGLV